MRAHTTELHRLARVHEIDRQLYSIRLMFTAMKWMGLPAMVLMAVYLAYFVVSRELGLSGNVVTGMVGLVTGWAGVFAAYRAARRRRGDLEDERAEWVPARSEEKGQ